MSNKEDQILAVIGDPKQLRKEMISFRKTALAFSSNKLHLMSKYRKQWVAAHGGKIVAHAEALPRLFRTLEELNIPRERAMIRYIDQDVRKLIL